MNDKKFALIVDEAHSSQSGTAAQEAAESLDHRRPEARRQGGTGWRNGRSGQPTSKVDPDDVTAEDVINQVMASRARPTNVSYFAFTATQSENS